MTARPASSKVAAVKKKAAKRGLEFGPINYAVMAAGLVSVILGYVLLDRGSVSAAPLLLILGYVILLPTGILLGWRRLEDEG